MIHNADETGIGTEQNLYVPRILKQSIASLRLTNIKRCSVRLYLQLFVGGFMSYLRYLCLFTYSVVQHILCCVFVLLPVSLDCPFLMAPSV